MNAEIPLWKRVLRTNFHQWDRLADFLELSTSQREQILKHPHFPLRLPRRLAEKIIKGTLDDPILRQFLPHIDEKKVVAGFVADPVGDVPAAKSGALLHKYQGRALLVCTGACAMHCRFCFRQNFDYGEGSPGFEKELAALAQDESISEVLLSGGDPLSLSQESLRGLIQSLEMIPHLKRLRFHTRFPIGIPERIDEPFLAMLSATRFQSWFVIHANHARELDADVLSALKRIQKIGIPVLHQAVLLKGVNDDLESLLNLYHTLIDQGIIPYYLHQLDRVSGAAHFEVAPVLGQQLIQQLMLQLPGYAVPRYVQEIAGMPSKVPVMAAH